MRNLIRLFATICAASSLTTGLAAAQAKGPAAPEGFRICNRSGQDVELATALDLGGSGGARGNYLSKGWYQVDAGQCVVMWPGPLQHRYFLIYAQNKETGREWKGDVPVCVSREPFELQSAACGTDKYSRLFVRVDAGNSASWTYNLRP